MSHPRAGQPAQAEDLVDVDALIGAYYDRHPDVDDPDQQVAFGTSGHRGSSLRTAFNEDHILATTQAIVDYRVSQGFDGPLFIGRDTHGLSEPAWRSALAFLNPDGTLVYTFVESVKATWPFYVTRLVGGLLNDSGAVATICLESLYGEVIAKVRDSTSLRFAITTSELDFQESPDPRLFAGVSRDDVSPAQAQSAEVQNLLGLTMVYR